MVPKTNVLTRALICLFLDLYLTYHPTGEVQVHQKAWKLHSDDVKASLQLAESNLNALNTVDLGPRRPFVELDLDTTPKKHVFLKITNDPWILGQ